MDEPVPVVPRKRKQKKRGRKTKFTPEVIDKLEYAFALGCSDVEACLYANVSEAALYNFQLRQPDFVDRKAMLKKKPILIARESVVNSLQRNPELALKFLERRAKKEFSPKNELDVTSKGEKIGGITPEQAEQLLRARANRTTLS